MIKMMAATVCASSVLFGFFALASDKGSTKDPCANKNSNIEIRQCYAKEQSRVNAEVDEIAKGMAADFRHDAEGEDLKNGPASEDLRKAASEVLQSQDAWKASRDHLCNAVAYSYTTGSGAGTGYESCMYELGRSRQRELEAAFK